MQEGEIAGNIGSGSEVNRFSIVPTTQNGVKTVITTGGSFLDLGLFSVQLSRYDNVDHLNLANVKESLTTESELSAVSGMMK